jgi:hypothetical protein
LAFLLAPLLLRDVRPLRQPVLCPVNWVVLIFYVQLVIVPLLVCFFGPVQSTLPAMPSDSAINLAMLLSAAAFVSFAAGYESACGWARRRPRTVSLPWRASTTIVALYAGLGVIGLALTFGSVSGLISYYATPTGHVADQQPAHGVASTLGLFLRPFLGFSVVLAWCLWIDARGRRRDPRGTAIVVTAIAVAMIVLTYGTFSYNRGAFAAPLVALAAVYLSRVRRVPLRFVLVGGILALVLLTAARAYRTTDASTRQPVRGSVTEAVLKQTNLNDELQVYGGGPQFLAFLLERTQYADHLRYGETILASVLYPVPVLGKPFRASSGVEIYNRLVYGIKPFLDQVIPATGELFLNFHVPGVLLGFFLVGTAVAAMQRRFVHAPTSAQAFVWQYAATWIAFLVVGSFAVVSQVLLYFFWPIYLLGGSSMLARRPGR